MFPVSALADVTTFNPWSIHADMDLADLLPLLENGGPHRWPVIDSQQRVIGMVSDEDVLRGMLEQRLAREAVAEGVRGPRQTPPASVQSLMSHHGVSISPDELPRRALRLLLACEMRSLPVVDRGRLVGVVAAADFLRELAYGGSPLAGEPVSKFALPDQEPIAIDAPLEEAKLAMDAAGRNYVAVERGGVPLGVVSRRDVRFARLRRAAHAGTEGHVGEGPYTLRDLVAEAPALRPGQPLREAAALLADQNLQAVVVVNQANRLVGVLSEDDILRALLDA